MSHLTLPKNGDIFSAMLGESQSPLQSSLAKCDSILEHLKKVAGSLDSIPLTEWQKSAEKALDYAKNSHKVDILLADMDVAEPSEEQVKQAEDSILEKTWQNYLSKYSSPYLPSQVYGKSPVQSAYESMFGSPMFVNPHNVTTSDNSLADTGKWPNSKKESEMQDWRRFEHTEGHNKFWSIRQDGCMIHKKWGKIGTDGQNQSGAASSAKAAAILVEQQINAKLAKGYKEVTKPSKTASKSSPKPVQFTAYIMPKKEEKVAPMVKHGETLSPPGLREINGMVLIPANCISSYSMNMHCGGYYGYSQNLEGEMRFHIPSDYQKRVDEFAAGISASQKNVGPISKPAVSRLFTLDED